MHDLTLDTSVKLPSLVVGDERGGVLGLGLGRVCSGGPITHVPTFLLTTPCSNDHL